MPSPVLAEQLYYIIKNYDICLIIAKIYIQRRAHDSTEECREFYMSKSEKRRRAKAAAVRRQKKEDAKREEEFDGVKTKKNRR